MGDVTCWKCAASLVKVALPFGRHAECPACHAPLHVCRQCRHFDPGKAKSCREPMAEPVQDKTRVNFCEWFQAGAHASSAGKPTEPARANLDALFGAGNAAKDAKASSSDPRKALDDLFGG